MVGGVAGMVGTAVVYQDIVVEHTLGKVDNFETRNTLDAQGDISVSDKDSNQDIYITSFYQHNLVCIPFPVCLNDGLTYEALNTQFSNTPEKAAQTICCWWAKDTSALNSTYKQQS